MKTINQCFASDILTVAVRGALALMMALPLTTRADESDNPEAEALKHPVSSIEIGAAGVNNTSAKFGEYSDLNKSGAYGIGGLDVRGGDAYDGGDGVRRWQIKGADIGTDAQSISANISDQGRWSIGIGYDELRHNITNTYQTPYVGSMGGNNFTLPSNFGGINTSAGYAAPASGSTLNSVTFGGNTYPTPSTRASPIALLPGSSCTLTGTTVYGARCLTSSQIGDFQSKNVYSDRENKSFNAAFTINPEWTFQFDYNRNDQSGAKLISSATEAFYNGVGSPTGLGDVVANVTKVATATNVATSIGTVTTPSATTNSATATTTTNVVAVTSYISGSSAKQTVTTTITNTATHTNFAGQGMVVLMNPTNYQTDTINMALNWTGEKGRLSTAYFGSLFSDKNNSLNWTNPFYSYSPGGTGTTNPLNALASNSLSTAPDNQFHQINLAGGYNFSPSLKLAGGASYGRNTQNDSYLTNSMYSGGLPQTSLDAVVETYNANMKLTDKVNKDLTLTAGFKYNERDNNTPSSTYQFYNLGGTANQGYNTPYSNKKTQLELAGDYRINSKNTIRVSYGYDKIARWCNNIATSTCVSAQDNLEHSFNLNYIFKPTDTVNINAGYTFAKREANINSTFYNVTRDTTTTNVEGNPVGAAAPDVVGFMPYFDASREENIAKYGANWQVSDKFDLGLNGRYVYDSYGSTLGVQNGQSWSLNLDSTYNYNENTIFSAYASMQRRGRDMLNAQTAGSNSWIDKLRDENSSIGFNAKRKGLMAGKLELAGDLSYVYGGSSYYTSPYTNGTNAPACSAAASLTCGSTPDISDSLLRLKLSGKYQIDGNSLITLGYLYQKLDSNDYYYNAYQMGYNPTSMLPTNQQNPSYTVSMLNLVYTYMFSNKSAESKK